jgi:hypothetical protein
MLSGYASRKPTMARRASGPAGSAARGFASPRDLVGPILFFPLAEIREGQGSRPVARGNLIQ